MCRCCCLLIGPSACPKFKPSRRLILIGGGTCFSKVRKQGPNRPLVVPWDQKRRGVWLIGAPHFPTCACFLCAGGPRGFLMAYAGAKALKCASFSVCLCAYVQLHSAMGLRRVKHALIGFTPTPPTQAPCTPALAHTSPEPRMGSTSPPLVRRTEA